MNCKFNNTTIYILPLLDIFTYEDISPKTGFINAYTHTTNTTGKIYLLFQSSILNMPSNTHILEKIKNSQYSFNEFYPVTSNIDFKVFGISLPTVKDFKNFIASDIKRMREGSILPRLIFSSSKHKIVSFWNGTPFLIDIVKTLYESDELLDTTTIFEY